MDNDKAPTLTEFVKARIAEREAVARAAVERNGAHWSTEQLGEGTRINGTVDRGNPRAYPDSPELWDDEGALGMFRETAAHIALHDPARVLAECEAKRAIVADRDRIDRSADGDEWSMGYSDANYSALHALAAVYADHPDYLPEWKP